MKKLWAILLALTLLLSTSASAFADENTVGEQTVSVTVPSYTVTIPANCTIEYGNTGNQLIGTVTVSSDFWDGAMSGKQVLLTVTQKNKPENCGMYLSYRNDSDEYKIGCVLQAQRTSPTTGNLQDFTGRDPEIISDCNTTTKLFMQVPSWESARSDETYSITLVYTASLESRS